MKKLLIVVIFLLISVIAKSTTYYVSTSGSNGNPGTFASPWLTWDYAFDQLSAGDILYVRGGTYTGMQDTNYGVNISNQDGTAADTIKIYAYTGETPVLNCAGLSGATTHYGVYMSGCDYYHIRGLTVMNVREYNNGTYSSKGWEISNCTNILFDRDIVHNCGNGFSFAGSAAFIGITYRFCDSYQNYDYYNSGDLANGYSANVAAASTIVYDRCRAWKNSDDGFDFYGSRGYFTVKNCWAFRNGTYVTSGNGSGIKIGAAGGEKESGTQRTVTECLVFDNEGIGIDESMNSPYYAIYDEHIYNNTAYRNEVNYNFVLRAVNTGDVKLTNNISYLYTGWNNNIRTEGITQTTNSWQGGIFVSAADFLSLDTAGVTGARGANGSMPILDFLKLASSSDMEGAGTEVGFGTDLGYYQYLPPFGEDIPTVITTSPNVGSTTATGGGNVTDDGGVSVIARGVCWSTSANPTTADSKTTDGTGTGSYVSSITGLTKGETYHVRAYATNSEGTAYGADIQFTTRSYRVVVSYD